MSLSDVSREICVLGRGNMHVSRHIRAPAHAAQERKSTHVHQKSTLTSQRYLNWHVTTPEEGNRWFFILRAQPMSLCKVLYEKTRDNTAKFPGKRHKKKENVIGNAQNLNFMQCWAVCITAQVSLHICLVFQFLFLFFFFFPKRTVIRSSPQAAE